MKLCEIVRGEKTAPDALMTAVAVAKRLAKGAKTYTLCGTPYYLSPELVMGKLYHSPRGAPVEAAVGAGPGAPLSRSGSRCAARRTRACVRVNKK